MSSILHSEISEQPEVIRRFLAREGEHIAEIGRQLARRRLCYVLMVGRGTSGNAARYGQYLFAVLDGLVVAPSTPSVFTMYHTPPCLDHALVIGISQSGQSPDIVAVLEEAHRQNAPTIAITNDPGSPLAAAAQHVVELHAGVEQSVAATKTYTAQLAAMALLAMNLSREPLPASLLEVVPPLLEQALLAEPAAEAAAERIAPAGRCVILGRGFNYSTAYEIALKTKELAYLPAEASSSATFKHGPIAMVEPGFPLAIVDVGETFKQELTGLRQQLRERGATLVVFGDDERARHPQDLWIPVPPAAPEWLTPLVAVVPGQLWAYHLALARGIDPDRPRAISKVTLTR
jgi:glucosamine--fructose-6-phosphate aminotransferase (isomerizing)